MKAGMIGRIAVAVAAACMTAEAGVTLKGSVRSAGRIAPLLNPTNAAYRVRRASAPPSVTGTGEGWQDVPAMVLDRREQSRGWDGPEDLSGALKMLWDEKGLYYHLEVADNVHCTPRIEGGWWENDCIQFAFDPHLNGPVGGYDPDDLSYVVFDSPNGPVFGSYRTPGTGYDQETIMPGMRLAVALRPDGVRVFEWFMSWAQLAPLTPWMLGRCGFSFTLNDNDGKGFKGALFWTRGIIWGQDASLFGELIFDDVDTGHAWVTGLRPESRISAVQSNSYWLNVANAAPWDTARLLVASPKPASVEAAVRIWREGEKKPVAEGLLRHEIAANEPTVFAWDVKELPNGSYRLEYSVKGVEAQRPPVMAFYQLSMLKRQWGALREQYGIDRPWDPMAAADPVLVRHRGMVAAALELMSDEGWTQMVSNKDAHELHLRTLAYVADMIEAIEKGRDFLGEQRGVFWSAYYCPADGSGQRFVIALPEDYKPGRTYPLFVHLHGAGGVPTPSGVTRSAAMPYIEVQPWGRGARSSYAGFGELDVLDVIAHMKTYYPIDPDRIYVTGASMGGGGAWRMASRHPDLFAAAGPVCGSADGLPLENLRNVPIINQHGDEDWRVPIDLTRYGVNRLLQLNYPVLHKELPKSGHSPVGLYPQRDWLLSQRRANRPDTVTFTCVRPEAPFNRAYWVRIDEFDDPHGVGRVDARIQKGCSPQALTLALENVQGVALDLVATTLDRSKPLLLQAGYEFLPQVPPLPERLFLARSGGRWAVTNAPAATGERPYRAGAAANLIVNEPLLIVYGTGGGEARVSMLKDAALGLSRNVGVHGGMASGGIPVRADRDVPDADQGRYNLILLGSAQENALTARYLPDLPLEITADGLLAAGGRPPVPLAGGAWRLFCRNPRHPSRLVYILATAEAGAAAATWYQRGASLLAGTGRASPADAPDLIVETLQGEPRRQMQCTHGWRWLAPDGPEQPLPPAMADALAYGRAGLRAMRRAAAADFAIGWRPREEKGKALKMWDGDGFTLADLACARSPWEMMTADMPGREILDLYRRAEEKKETLLVPETPPADLSSNAIYRIVMHPSLTWSICLGRQKNLMNTRYAPPCPVESFWAEVLGTAFQNVE